MKQKLGNKRYKKLVLLFLAALIVFGSIPSAAMMHGNQSEEHIDEHIYFDVLTPPTEAETISESRRKYLELLRGGYNNYQLRHRFRELFGDAFSGEYIFHNYRTIFDLREDEIIDSAFLRVLSGYRIDFRFQDTGNDGLGRSAYGDGIVRIFPDSDVSGIQGFGAHDFDDSFFERMFADALVPEFIDYSEAFNQQNDVDAQMSIEPFSSNMVSISVVSRTNTSITVNLQFQNSNSPNNALSMRDPGTATWRWLLSVNEGKPPAINGNFTIEDLSPGVTYLMEAWTWDAARQIWVNDRIVAVTTLPAENLVSHTRSSVDFRLDSTFTDALGSALTNRFLDATNQAFYSIHALVGGQRPDKMEIVHTRYLPIYIEGWSGWPIFWQLFNSRNIPVFFSLDNVPRMVAANVETTEIPIHEIGHNFDNWRWSFETEALAILFTYYYYATTRRSMAVHNQSRIFVGPDFRIYMRSYAYRMLGQINHQEAMRRGVYSSYSLAYVLGSIAGQIGWSPFMNTFRYFHNMDYEQVPRTNLGKLNLFLTRLRHYSDRDVIAMIPADARTIFEQFFGGRIQYLTAAPTIINPANNSQVPAQQNLLITWEAPGASYYIVSMRRVTRNPDGSACLPQRTQNEPFLYLRYDWFRPGYVVRIAVQASVGGNMTDWAVHVFTVAQPLTTFSIRYVNNLPNTTGTLTHNRVCRQTEHQV